MRARRAPTGTVESTGTSIERITPATGDGISVSTLSVETSSRASSTATESPTPLSQRVTVPSVTDSPRAGIETTVPDVEGATGAGASAKTGASATTGAGVGTTVGATGAAGVSTAAEPSAMIASSAPTGTV